MRLAFLTAFCVKYLTRIRDKNYFRGLLLSDTASGLTDVMCRLNQIHPFREGNGRTQRLFVEQLASNAGYDLDFSHVSENDMRNASFAASVQGDTRLMRYLIFSNMTETGALGPVEYVREQPVSSEQVGLRDRFVGGIKKMRVVAVTCRIWIQRLKL